MFALVKEGRDVEVDYQAGEAWVTFSALAACGPQHYLCTVMFMTTRIFEICKCRHEEKYDERPHVGFDTTEPVCPYSPL